MDGRVEAPEHGLHAKPGLEDHRRMLARIRADNDREEAWWEANLSALVRDLENLRARFLVAERSVRESEALARWNEAIHAIAGSPEYGGLRFAPQLELLPLGEDPGSGLWEFAHLATGEPALRGEDGKLVPKAETGLVFMLLPAGRAPVEDGKEPTPLNEVFLAPFFLSKYEMTIDQWRRTTHWKLARFMADDPLMPAHDVSWNDCVATLERAGLFLRLPTEAQWEYGCRAGTTTAWWTGADEETLRVAANLGGRFEPVGGLRANEFGLHDVHGNVSEWCRDEYVTDDDPNDPVLDGDGAREGYGGSYRAFRGGSFQDPASDVRSAYRIGTSPGTRFPALGLRPARVISSSFNPSRLPSGK